MKTEQLYGPVKLLDFRETGPSTAILHTEVLSNLMELVSKRLNVAVRSTTLDDKNRFLSSSQLGNQAKVVKPVELWGAGQVRKMDGRGIPPVDHI